MRVIVGVIFLLVTGNLHAGDTTEGSGAMEVLYEAKVCITDPCPQYKILSLNGESLEISMGADLMNLEPTSMPQGKPVLLMGSWIREGNYFKVRVKEWILVAREKVIESKKTEEKQ